MSAYMKLIFTGVVFLIFIASVYEYVENNEKNGCEMTYMFEMPEYVEQKMDRAVRRKFPRYQLYAYGEGEQNPPVQGIPVLFIPGNAGSYKQVRSMASVALRMSQHRSLTTMFDFFAIDFNEELYGFYGGDLQQQTEYVKECINHILSLYTKKAYIPNSIVLVGHSMGGILARAVLTLRGFDKSLVNLIITQATPHQAPILYTDYLPSFYNQVNSYWRKEKNSSLKHVTVISLGGGDRDLLVNYHLTRLEGLVEPNRAVSVNTESVPRAWVSTDHLCAVWCKQIVLSIVRGLCDLTQRNSNQLKSKPSEVREVFGFHMVNNTGHYSVQDTRSKLIEPKAEFEYDNLDTDYLLLHNYMAKMDKYFSFKVDKHQHDHMVIEASNNWRAWVIGCTQSIGEDSCSKGTDLTDLLRLAPTKSHRVYMHIEKRILLKYTHIVLHVPSTPTHIFLHAVLFNTRSLDTVYHAPTFTDLLLDFPRSVYHHLDPVINSTKEQVTYHRIQLPTIRAVYQSYVAHVTILECSSDKVLPSFMRLHLPWALGSDTFTTINPSDGSGSMSLKLHVPFPQSNDEQAAQLHLYLQPTCKYRLDVQIDFKKILSQFARHYYMYLPSFIVTSLFAILCHQLFVVSKGQSCPSVASAQETHSQPWKLALVTTLMEFILLQDPIYSWLPLVGVPTPDGVIIRDKGLAFIGLHLVLHTLAFVILRVYAALTHLLLAITGFVFRFLFHSVIWWVALVLGIYSSWHHSGSIGLLVTYTLIVADIISSLVTFPKDDRRYTMWYLQHTLLLLTLTMFVLSLPEFSTWIKNYRFIKTLEVDPFRYPSIVIATSLMLIRFNTDYENWYLSYVYSFTPIILGVVAVIFGTVNIWRLNVLIPSAFVWVASVQSLGILLHRQKHSHKIVSTTTSKDPATGDGQSTQ